MQGLAWETDARTILFQENPFFTAQRPTPRRSQHTAAIISAFPRKQLHDADYIQASTQQTDHDGPLWTEIEGTFIH